MRRVILATGSRDFDDQEVIDRTLSLVEPDLIIHGAARGADRMVQDWADRNGSVVARVTKFPDGFASRLTTQKETEVTGLDTDS